MDNFYETSEEGFLARFKDFFQDPTPQQLQFASNMFRLIASDIDTTKITVASGRCGIGKSLFLRALVSYFCTFDDYSYRNGLAVGMIIITDDLERLQEYQKEPQHIRSVWGRENDVSINRHSTYISSKSEKSAMELLIEAQYRPIVILTTQRFFSMSDEQRDMLLEYTYTDHKKQKIKQNREIIIFDEKPYFSGTVKIDAKNFNDCSTALQNGIPESLKNREDKDWLLQEYHAFRDKMTSLLREKEKTSSNVDRFYWRDHYTNNMTSNDERFFGLLEKYKKTICKQYVNAITDFRNFKSIMTDGAFFTTTKNAKQQDYETYFQIFKDNKDKFYLGENKVKCFVFDATADIDPDYDLDYISPIDCSRYNTPINMIINFSDVASSKSQLVNSSNADMQAKAIFETITNLCHKDDLGKTLIVTYQAIKDKFKNNNFSVGYFGNIKGMNTFSDYVKFAHVGNNRFDSFAYFIKYLAQSPLVFEQLKRMDEPTSRNFILETSKLHKGLFVNSVLNKIMFSSLLADFEQNIFRTAIRNFGNEEDVRIYTFWNCKMFEPLNKLIEYRYEPFGVKFKYLGVSDAILKMKTETRNTKEGKMTNPQKILEWYAVQPQGKVFKLSEMLKELNISNDDLKNAKKNSQIKVIFEKAKTDKQGYYKAM